MAQEANPVEQAVARALRENLEKIQRDANELHQAVADIVAACASSKPTNALPSMLRAQTSAASLTAGLEVLTKFVAMAVQPGQRSPLEAQITHLMGIAGIEPAAEPVRPIPSAPTPMAQASAPAAHAPAAHPPVPAPASNLSAPPKQEAAPAAHTPPAPPVPVAPAQPEPELELQAEAETIELTESAPVAAEEDGEFDVNQLSVEEQELHRRANRVAKVSMQDIKMLRPEQVRLGREKKDLCNRLKDDIEKAHREYDRRFKPIMDHPVDYFYRWMVEILAEGDAHALGEYPYATPARHR
jgi:hypothetical protein